MKDALRSSPERAEPAAGHELVTPFQGYKPEALTQRDALGCRILPFQGAGISDRIFTERSNSATTRSTSGGRWRRITAGHNVTGGFRIALDDR
jgi:hypothetical protein